MKDLKHPHIVGFKESFLEDDELIIVLEFCECKHWLIQMGILLSRLRSGGSQASGSAKT